MRITLPESVHRYCTDARIASAVDILLSGKAPKMPDRLQWDELEDFYRACLAAQQTRIEWAIAMNGLWDAIFANQIDSWRPSTIDQQAEDSEIRLDAEYLWTEGEFTRDFTRGDFSIQLQVEFISDEGIRANALLWNSGKTVRVPLPEGAELVGDWTCSAWLPIGKMPDLDLDQIRSQTQAAIAAASRVAEMQAS